MVYDCLLVGDVFLDVVIRLPNDHKHFFRGGTTYVNLAKAAFGGSGNIAAGLSWLGGKVAFLGKAGNDFLGKSYMQDLEKRGVDARICLDQEFPTGLVVVLLSDGVERSFVVFRGANDRLCVEDVENITDLFEKSTYFYFSGYSLVNDPQRSAIFRAIKLAKQCNAKIVFDPGAYNLIKAKPEIFNMCLHLCDIFVPNLDEAIAVSNCNSLNETVEYLRNEAKFTALKRSNKGCILISKNEVLDVLGSEVKCVDPSGAGDAFTSALIFGLARELDIESVGLLANWFAAKVITRIGPRSFPAKKATNLMIEKLL